MFSKPTIDLIHERLFAAVRSIENANQESDSQEIINITRNGSICHKINVGRGFFELGR